jgi:hypothetical protein
MPFKFFNNPTSKDKNSFSYFKYAFGEIFLVAIGVLIAVQVNNWNEVRLLKIQKKENLLNLYNAIKKDSEFLSQLHDANNFRHNSINQLLKWTKVPINKLDSFTPNLASKSIWNKPVPENYNEEFYKTTIAWVNRSKKMMIQSYAMDELKSSGFYSKLNNENLKTLLNDYYNDLYWVFGDEDNHKNINELHEYLRDKYNLVLSDLAYLKKPIQFIKTEKSLIVRLRLISNRANWRSYRAKVSQLMAEKVLIALKEEIDS